MIKITFLNVGQGDSIVLEWIDDDNKRVLGLIDSNLYNGSNPTINYLKTAKFDFIKFIILSHPHSDHFCGLLEVIEYCELNSIEIKHFSHTSKLKVEYLQTCFNDAISISDFSRLFEKINELNKLFKLKCSGVDVGLCDTIFLNSKLKLKFLSPSKIEEDKFINNENYEDINEEEPGCNIRANSLSTFIKIQYDDEWYALLTADSDKSTFYRILKKETHELKNKLVLAQCSHHGSILNFSHLFWQKINKNSGTPVAISVGKNSYGHPDPDIIKKLLKLNFKVHSTNSASTLKSKKNQTVSALNTFSKLIVPIADNLSFSIDQKGLVQTL